MCARVDEKATKSLIDHGKYKHLDFYEYKMYLTPVHESDTSKLVDKLFKEEHFSEGITATYLAMVSMVVNRTNHLTDKISRVDHQIELLQLIRKKLTQSLEKCQSQDCEFEKMIPSCIGKC